MRPRTVVIKIVGVINGVNTLPIVQAQMGFAAALQNFDIVISGFGFVNLSLRLLDAASIIEERENGNGDDHQQIRECFTRARTFGETDEGNEKQKKAKDEKSVRRPDGGDENENGQISAEK